MSGDDKLFNYERLAGGERTKFMWLCGILHLSEG